MSKVPTNQQWQAIAYNDASYDNQFFYGVRTTKIFCRPSCKSRLPKRENIIIFTGKEAAMAAGYRPCKRCRSGGERVPDEEWTASITAYLNTNYQEHLTLERIAEDCHGSAYHLHRVFKKQLGMTPLAYLHQIRMEKAKEQLASTSLAISEIAVIVGIANVAQFATLFKKLVGSTPTAYRTLYAGKD